jgi:hypothetical protein
VESKLIPIISILMPLVLVPMVMIIRHHQRKREWAHLERMKSLELGLPLGQEIPIGGVATIGAGVPAIAMIVAWLTTINILDVKPEPDPEFFAIIWVCAAGVSVMAMIIALILGVIQARAQSKSLRSGFGMNLHAKPAFDPEAYEFAGH